MATVQMKLDTGCFGKVARPTWGSMSHLPCFLLTAEGFGNYEKSPEILAIQSSWAPLISD